MNILNRNQHFKLKWIFIENLHQFYSRNFNKFILNVSVFEIPAIGSFIMSN